MKTSKCIFGLIIGLEETKQLSVVIHLIALNCICTCGTRVDFHRFVDEVTSNICSGIVLDKVRVDIALISVVSWSNFQSARHVDFGDKWLCFGLFFKVGKELIKICCAISCWRCKKGAEKKFPESTGELWWCWIVTVPSLLHWFQVAVIFISRFRRGLWILLLYIKSCCMGNQLTSHWGK